ncbi:MAG: hypothetical protein EOP48_12435 [Sphingobacteriales bacterium]|nr:MAG: hypothetical protein EOP48_12435 [Sphingobacteriales bacterium]
MKLLFFFLLIASCSQTQESLPKRINLADYENSFLLRHLSQFSIDSTFIQKLKLEGNLFNRSLVPDTAFFDSLLGKYDYLLYSWQEESSKNFKDFTVLTSTHFDPGLELHYIRLDDNNLLLFNKVVARRVFHRNGSTFILSSKILSGDTLLMTRISNTVAYDSNYQIQPNLTQDTFEYEYVLSKDEILRAKRNDELIR